MAVNDISVYPRSGIHQQLSAPGVECSGRV